MHSRLQRGTGGIGSSAAADSQEETKVRLFCELSNPNKKGFGTLERM
jgi:hypothetical protein